MMTAHPFPDASAHAYSQMTRTIDSPAQNQALSKWPVASGSTHGLGELRLLQILFEYSLFMLFIHLQGSGATFAAVQAERSLTQRWLA